jgi:hypothetical protein
MRSLVRDVRDAGWIVVTDQRVRLLKQDTFRRYAAVDLDLPLADVRYVRFRDRGPAKAPEIDVVTTKRDVTIKFESWAKEEPHRRKAEQFSDVLRSFMHIPVDEVPKVDIPELFVGGEASALGSSEVVAGCPKGS